MDEPLRRFPRCAILWGAGVITVVIIMYVGGAFSLGGGGCRIRPTKVESDSRVLLWAAAYHRVRTGRYPSDLEDLIDLRDESGLRFLSEPVFDPYGNEYRYELLEDRARVTFLGADGFLGGGDDTIIERTFEELDADGARFQQVRVPPVSVGCSGAWCGVY